MCLCEYGRVSAETRIGNWLLGGCELLDVVGSELCRSIKDVTAEPSLRSWALI